MVWVEINIIDVRTNKLAGKYSKSFDNLGDFRSWYRSTKDDCDTIMNIMMYNPEEYGSLKLVRDASLLRIGRTNAI